LLQGSSLFVEKAHRYTADFIFHHPPTTTTTTTHKKTQNLNFTGFFLKRSDWLNFFDRLLGIFADRILEAHCARGSKYARCVYC
jgi:hypothetical protein